MLPEVSQAKPRSTTTPADPEPDCPICLDDGVVTAAVHYGHPDFGKAMLCVCAKRKRFLELPWLGHSLAEFEKEPGTKEALGAAWKWAKGEIAFLTISGIPGCGKSHLSIGAVRHHLENDRAAAWRDVTDTLEWFKESFDKKGDEATIEFKIALLTTAAPLALDDIGAEQSTEWSRPTLTRIINRRKLHRYPTMFTTNHLPETLAQWTDARIASRVFDYHDGTVVIMKGAKDYRAKGG